MDKKKPRRRKETTEPTPFEQARDEMFQHIMRCGVIGADKEHQVEWFSDTIGYLAERFHELTPEQVAELKTLGERFVQPPAKAAAAESPQESASAA